MRRFMNIRKALVDESLIRLQFMPRDGELCAWQLVEVLAPPVATVSKHSRSSNSPDWSK